MWVLHCGPGEAQACSGAGQRGYGGTNVPRAGKLAHRSVTTHCSNSCSPQACTACPTSWTPPATLAPLRTGGCPAAPVAQASAPPERPPRQLWRWSPSAGAQRPPCFTHHTLQLHAGDAAPVCPMDMALARRGSQVAPLRTHSRWSGVTCGREAGRSLGVSHDLWGGVRGRWHSAHLQVGGHAAPAAAPRLARLTGLAPLAREGHPGATARPGGPLDGLQGGSAEV